MLEKLAEGLDTFGVDRRGNVAMISALALVPTIAMGGIGLDAVRQMRAKQVAQDSIDAAVLAAARSQAVTNEELKAVADNFIRANIAGEYAREFDTVLEVDPDTGVISYRFSSELKSYFGGLVGRETMPINVRASAARGGAEILEMVLVLDNTYSMSADAGGGETRLQALQRASRELINSVMVSGKQVRISIVPYADYINVGLENRDQPWLEIEPDHDELMPGFWNDYEVCEDGPETTCSGTVDGIEVNYACLARVNCTTERQWYPDSYFHEEWWGCVKSRHEGDLRLTDAEPDKPYPGIVIAWKTCLNPIVPLTNDRDKLLAAIDGLIVSEGAYQPNTYIPAGMIWGVNVLSPTAPFTEGAAYDSGARKILVLMSDGANTMWYDAPDGSHYNAEGTVNEAELIAETDASTRAICEYAKSQGIEVFTIGLAVPIGGPRNLMRDCASNSTMAFNANDTTGLLQAFRSVAGSISTIKLVR